MDHCRGYKSHNGTPIKLNFRKIELLALETIKFPSITLRYHLRHTTPMHFQSHQAFELIGQETCGQEGRSHSFRLCLLWREQVLMDRVVGVSYEQMAGISHTCTYDCRFFVYTYDIYTNIYIRITICISCIVIVIKCP